MKTYIVGGAVRDALLDIEPNDIDYCVVGTTPEEMIHLGFKKIEATSFPVFHDKDHNEYALARTETKTGDGYHGFDCVYDSSVLLEEDLYRRDLSFNSMAVYIEDWEQFKSTKDLSYLIDPYNGLESIQNKEIVHTSEHFKDDPVRAIRALRLAARYNFKISDPTSCMIRTMIEDGELSHLTPERIWLEITKVLESKKNLVYFFDMLESTGMIDAIFPKCDDEVFLVDYENIIKYEESTIDQLDFAFLSLVNFNTRKYMEHFCKELKLSNYYIHIFNVYKEINLLINHDGLSNPSKIIECFNKINVFQTNTDFFLICNYIVDIMDTNIANIAILSTYYIEVRDISFKDLKDKTLKGKDIGNAINQLRISKLDKL